MDSFTNKNQFSFSIYIKIDHYNLKITTEKEKN